MYIKEIKYSGLNGLSNSFVLSKNNIFEGSNGVGKTTSLDALSIMLTGESITYGKKIEKHLDIYDSKKIEIEMKLNTGITQMNEEGDVIEIEPTFSFKMTPSGAKSWYVNGTKKTITEYMDILYKWFKIPSEYYNLKSVEFVKMIMRPEQIEKEDSNGLYDFIKKLIGVEDLSNYEGLKNYDLIITNLVENNYNIDETIKQLKAMQVASEKQAKSLEEELDKIQKRNEEIQKSFDGEEYNKNVDEYYRLIDFSKVLSDEIVSLQNESENEKKQNNSDLITTINKKQEELNQKYNVLNTNISNKGKVERDLVYFKNEIEKCTHQNIDLEEEKTRTENLSFNAIICEHCGNVANENQKQQFLDYQANSQKELEDAIKNNKSTVSLYNSSVKQCNDDIKLLDSKILETSQEIDSLNAEIQTLLKKSNEDYIFSKNDILLNKQKELETTKTKINEICEKGRLKEISDLLNEISQNSGLITYTENLIDDANSKTNDIIQKQSYAEKLKNEYAQFVENRTNEVFGDIDFSLVKENKTNSKNKINIEAIKNGKGMSNYNTGDKILLQFEIINKIKAKIGIVGLPFIIDITDNIDNENLKAILNNCEGQFFGTRVVSNNQKLTLNKEI